MSQATLETLETIELSVEGLHCGGCSGRLQRTLNAKEGVQSSTASHETKRVSVAYDSALLNEARIREHITDAGFTVIS
ncbi:MAG: heavy-metal-associated domain-containing protein [Candidatus Accumulibacter sp.]|jgi:copper chaperone|nr:heavy-metal-associated domain-containing protein [Accumulibacter sp.]